jgi:integrase
MPKFSDFALKNLPVPSHGQVTYKDEGTALNIRVSQGGSKTFFVTLDGTGRRHKIGRYGEVTLSQARDAARRLKAEKTLGRIFPASTSLADARTGYLEQLDVRPNTKAYYERNLGRLKGAKLTDITPRDINRILDALGKTSADQALASYRAFFKWCIRRHYLDKSPCDRMTLSPSPSRARILFDEELKAIWQACEANRRKATVSEQREPLLAESSRPPDLPEHFCTIVKLLILTGQRRGEIAALQSLWIKDNTITIPKEITKNGREHTFPRGTLASSLLMTNTTTGFLFPARGRPDRPFNGWSKSKAALDKASGVTNWTLHDLRRTYRTIHGKIGTPPHIAERLVNHVNATSEVEKIYDRWTYMPEMQAAVGNFEEYLSTVLNAK